MVWYDVDIKSIVLEGLLKVNVSNLKNENKKGDSLLNRLSKRCV